MADKVFKFKHTSKISPSQTAGQIHALLESEDTDAMKQRDELFTANHINERVIKAFMEAALPLQEVSTTTSERAVEIVADMKARASRLSEENIFAMRELSNAEKRVKSLEDLLRDTATHMEMGRDCDVAWLDPALEAIEKEVPSLGKPADAEPAFYILSLKWTKPDEPLVVWWRPENKGYVTSLDGAGRYTKEEIEADPKYYNNGESTLAVPCEIVESHTVTIRSVARRVVQASEENKEALLVAAKPQEELLP